MCSFARLTALAVALGSSLSTAAVLPQIPFGSPALSSETLTAYARPEFPGHRLRVKEPKGLCDADVKQVSGYLDTDGGHHFFFWSFESRNDPKNDPDERWAWLLFLLHIDPRDDHSLFTTIIPEAPLPKGSTLGAFLMAEFGAVVDLLSYDETTGKEDYTVAVISGDTPHVGTDVSLAPPSQSDEDSSPESSGDQLRRSQLMFRAVSVNYATYAAAASRPVIPSSPGDIVADPDLYRANIRHLVVVQPNGPGSAAWGSDETLRFILAQDRARKSLWQFVHARLIEENDFDIGAPRHLTAAELANFSEATREAVWAAARQVEEQDGISWRSEWERAGRLFRLPPERIAAEIDKPNPFGCHGDGWRARLVAVEQLALRSVSFRNGIRGWVETSDDFKERSGNRFSTRADGFVRDTTAPRDPPAPPIYYLPLLLPPLAPSLVARAGLTFEPTAEHSFEQRFRDNLRRSRNGLSKSAWSEEKDFFAPFVAAHKAAILDAEAHFLGSDNSGEDQNAAMPLEPPPPRVQRRIRWTWTREAAAPSPEPPQQQFLPPPGLETAAAGSSAELPAQAGAQDAPVDSSLNSTGSKRTRDVALPDLAALAATDVPAPKRTRSQPAKKASSATKSASALTAAAAATALASSARISNEVQAVAPLTKSDSRATVVLRRLVESPQSPADALSGIAWTVEKYPSLAVTVTNPLVAMRDAVRLARPPSTTSGDQVPGLPVSAADLSASMNAVNSTANSLAAADVLVRALAFETLGVLAHEVETVLWPAAFRAAESMFDSQDASSAGDIGTLPENVVERVKHVQAHLAGGSSSAFPSADARFTWFLPPPPPAPKRPARQIGAQADARRRRDLFSAAMTLLDLSLLDILALDELSGDDGAAPVDLIFAGFLRAHGPLAPCTDAFLRELHFRLALISAATASCGSSAIFLLPVVQEAIRAPIAFQRESCRAEGSKYPLSDVADWLPALYAYGSHLASDENQAALARLNASLAPLDICFPAFSPAKPDTFCYPISPEYARDDFNTLHASSSRNSIYARDRRFLAALSEYGIESSLTDAAAAREDDESDDELDSEPEPDDEADLTYLTAEDQRDMIRQFRQLEAARRGQRALAHYTLRQSDTAVKTLVDAIQNKRKALRRARRRANRLEGYEANLNWLCTVFCETLFIGKLLYPESFPIVPSSSASLSARHDALVASSTGRALVGAIEKQIDGRGLDFALWLKTGHEIEMLALPNLARLEVDDSSPSDRRRRAFSAFVLRGVLVGSTPAVWALLPADGWLNRAEFAEWLRRPEVAALRTRSSGPNRAWTNGAPYGSWMELDLFHIWSYDEHVDTFLSYLDRHAEIADADLPSYRAVVNLLRTWEVAKTDVAGRGETYDERRARVRREKARRQADRDGVAGDVEMEEAAENDEPASSSSVSEPALPILGGSLSSLHVASDLVRFGLVAPPTDEEMAALLDRMTLGASRGLAELGFIRTRAQEVDIVGEGGAATTVRLEKTSAGPAFGKFATVFRKSLKEDINKVFREAGITLSASLLENLLCKFSRGSWGKIRDDADFRKVIESLPWILDTADPLWRDRGSPVDVANLRDRLVALAEEEETLVDQLLQAEAAVDELENRPVR